MSPKFDAISAQERLDKINQALKNKEQELKRLERKNAEKEKGWVDVKPKEAGDANYRNYVSELEDQRRL